MTIINPVIFHHHIYRQRTASALSLAFDIVMKVHGGTLELESKEAEGAEFIVKSPC